MSNIVIAMPESDVREFLAYAVPRMELAEQHAVRCAALLKGLFGVDVPRSGYESFKYSCLYTLMRGDEPPAPHEHIKERMETVNLWVLGLDRVRARSGRSQIMSDYRSSDFDDDWDEMIDTEYEILVEFPNGLTKRFVTTVDNERYEGFYIKKAILGIISDYEMEMVEGLRVA